MTYEEAVQTFQSLNPGNALRTNEEQDQFNAWSGSLGGFENVSVLDAISAAGGGGSTPQQTTADFFGIVDRITSDFFMPLSFNPEPSLVSNLPASFVGPTVAGPAVGPTPAVVSPLSLVGSPSGTQTSGGLNTNPVTGNSTDDYLSELLRGVPSPVAPGGTNISPITIAPQTTSIFYDSSNRSTNSTTTNVNTTTTVNSESLVNSILSGVKGFFGSPATAANAEPFNDATQTRGALQPGIFSAGQVLTPGASTPSSLGNTIGTLTTTSTQSSNAIQTKLLYAGVIVGILGLLYTIFRRGT